MTSFVALYRGQTISAAKIVAVSADPKLVRDFAARMLAEPGEESDAVLLDSGRARWRAVQTVRSEADE